MVQKQWYVMPENAAMEIYGYVDTNNVIRYDVIRPRGAQVPYVVPFQVPMPRTFTMGACLPSGGGS